MFKVFARRLHKVLSLLVCSEGKIHTTFWNKQNSRTFQVSSCNLTFKKPLTPLIEWKFIQNIIQAFFFFYSESIQRWNSTFYSDFPSSVLNNGYSANTTSHLLTKGIRQGCPLCPNLFFLGVEHLAGKIRQGKEIQGINIFHRELKICR